MEKQRLLYQQARLHNRGAAEMVLQMISACKGAFPQALLLGTCSPSPVSPSPPFPGDPMAHSPTLPACASHPSPCTSHSPCNFLLFLHYGTRPQPLLLHTLGWLSSGGWRTGLPD